MGCKKGKCHRQALLAQFCYEHQKLECCMRKIRKNAEELCKILCFIIFKNKKHRPRGNRNVRKNSVLSAPSGARTLDTLIKSQVLYQLS